MNRSSLAGAVVLLALASGCASSPAAPFDTLKNAQTVWALRLQNYEPPAAAAAQGPAAAIPGLPPQIQQWLQQGAQALPQLIPPGLLPPGLLPNLGAAAAPPPQPDAKRFQGFRVLSETQVVDSDLREELAELLGDEDSFQAENAGCQFSEMGLAWQSGGVSNELLVSFSCNQVIARTFAWPHPYTGMKPKTVKELSEIVSKLWPPGA
jgi:hypothetical protein